LPKISTSCVGRVPLGSVLSRRCFSIINWWSASFWTLSGSPSSARNFAAAVGLGVAVLATGRLKKWPKGLKARELGFLAFIAITDLVLGSVLYIYSISLVGVALTVILTSLSPLLTQLFSRALGKETPTRKDYAGGVLIVAALVIALSL
jgi:DME family drug/metabolite transporter